MKYWTTLLIGAGLAIAVYAATTACGSSEAGAGAEVAGEGGVDLPVEGPATEPDAKRLIERITERWNYVVDDEWIQVYDFEMPSRREVLTLGQFLSGKDKFNYTEFSKPVLVAIEDDMGYVELNIVWDQSKHPLINQADNLPEGTPLNEVIHTVETWVWQDGEWYWTATERIGDFYDAHPKLRGASSQAGADEQDAQDE